MLPRNGRAETLFFEWQSEGLCLTAEPQAVPELRAIDRMEQRVFATVQPGEEVKHQPGFGNASRISRAEMGFWGWGRVKS